MKNNRRKHFALQLTNLPSFASYMLLPRQKKFFLPSLCSGFTRPSLTKGTDMYTGGIKRGVAEARPLSGQRPHAPGLFCCTWEITALHTSTLAKRRRERILRPITVHPHLGQTLGIVWNLQRPRKARRKERKRGERVRIKNSGRGSKAFGKPYAPFGKIGFPVDTSI